MNVFFDRVGNIVVKKHCGKNVFKFFHLDLENPDCVLKR